MIDSEFTRIAAVLAIAAVFGLLAIKLRQPLIVAFIGVGVLAGPVGFGWVETGEGVDVLAKLGIALLLFLVGLKLDFHLIRATGPVALVTGLGQVIFTSAVGFAIAIALGMDTVTALYVAVALTFSSTIIIVKLLSDKRELEELHGRIAIGFLIVQDIVVVLVMIGLTAFGGETDDPRQQVFRVLGIGVALVGGTAVFAKWILPVVLPLVARSSELLVLFSVAWAVAVAALSDGLGFSFEVGAFLAGVALASTPYREAVAARLVSLRDFLLLFFFLDLGAGLEFGEAGRQLMEAGILSAFVLIGNPFIVMVIMGVMGYRARTSFLAGLTVAQISEFSLILVALGLSLGHIGPETVSLVTVIGLVTIGMSTYLILGSKHLFDRYASFLRRFERNSPSKPTSLPGPEPVDVVLFGLGRVGDDLARRFLANGHRVLGIDADPHAVAKWNSDGMTALLGDASDPQLLQYGQIPDAKLVVSTLPAPDLNIPLLRNLKREGYRGQVAVVARSGNHATRYSKEGADPVLEPFKDIAVDLAALIEGDDPA